MNIGSILDVWLGSQYTSEIMFPWMYDPWGAILKYTKISLQKTLFNLKLKVQILTERKYVKQISISSMLDKLSATAMKCLTVT